MAKMRAAVRVAASLVLVTSACMSGACSGPTTEITTATSRPTSPGSTSTTEAAPDETTSVRADPIDLVVIGDSFGMAAWPSLLGSMIEEDLDAEVSLHNLSRVGNPDYARFLTTGTEQPSGAEIVILQPDVGAPLDVAEPKYLAGTCGGADGDECLRAEVADFSMAWELFLDDLLEIVPEDAVIRMLTVAAWTYEGFYGTEFLDDPAFPVFLGYMMLVNDLAAAAAEERGIVVVDVNRTFNGDDYSRPAPREWLAPDLLHLSDEGSLIVATLIRDAGHAE